MSNHGTDTLKRSSRPSRLLAVAVAAVALCAGAWGSVAPASAAPASSPASIEGVWSFNGGRVAIQAQPDGEFTGTVVAPTTFALCPHPVGERMWSSMRQQPDGSYAGLHQWYIEPSCTPNPRLGPTAWRVLEDGNGTRFLRVCFSFPGSSQPTIAANGSSANVTSPPCIDSALIAPLPVAPPAPTTTAGGVGGTQGFVGSAALPSARRCLSKRSFQIHLRDPSNDPLRRVLVTLSGRRVRVVRHAHTVLATIDLNGLPAGAFKVRIRATTVLGYHLSSSRTYHTCASRPLRPAAHKHR